MADLWPDDIANVDIRTPVSILREQATALGKKTKNIVKAEVRSVTPSVPTMPTLADVVKGIAENLGDSQDSIDFMYAFYIVAPALGGYRYRLFTIVHKLTMYPLLLQLDDDVIIEAHSEEEFLNALKNVFSSDKTRRIIKIILSQSEGLAAA